MLTQTLQLCLLLTYLTFYIIDLLTPGVSFYDSVFKVFGLTDYPYKGVLTNIFVYIVAQIQILITYILIKYEVERLGISINLSTANRLYYYIFVIADFVIAILAYYLFPNFCLTFSLLTLPIIIDELINLIVKQNKWIYVSLGISLVAFIFLFALLYQRLEAPNQLFVSFIFFGFVTIIDFIFNYCLKLKSEKIK